ncbi:MAG: DNA-directed RNA polymerase subunit omega [Firmicutes bacterium]|jgi:DNA-directed RNA polymerase subunit omega|nr:DNA-directed RNA polymerase subunit omega [Bacillota bacterium]
MMNQPPIEQLLDRVDSRYTLVVAAAKRARQVLDGSLQLVEADSTKPVTIALWEIGEGKITPFHEKRKSQ